MRTLLRVLISLHFLLCVPCDSDFFCVTRTRFRVLFSLEAGGRNYDTRGFDDKRNISGALVAVTVHADQYVRGIQFTYCDSINGADVVGPIHGFASGEASTFRLQPGESFVSVAGRSGSWMDRLVLFSSHGRVMEWGGYGGNPFSLAVPPHAKIASFFGSKGDEHRYVCCEKGQNSRTVIFLCSYFISLCVAK